MQARDVLAMAQCYATPRRLDRCCRPNASPAKTLHTGAQKHVARCRQLFRGEILSYICRHIDGCGAPTPRTRMHATACRQPAGTATNQIRSTAARVTARDRASAPRRELAHHREHIVERGARQRVVHRHLHKRHRRYKRHDGRDAVGQHHRGPAVAPHTIGTWLMYGVRQNETLWRQGVEQTT